MEIKLILCFLNLITKKELQCLKLNLKKISNNVTSAFLLISCAEKEDEVIEEDTGSPNI